MSKKRKEEGRNQSDPAERRDTQVLTRGFDPRLSVGSARPAVFRSSTYVFSSPESAERAFAIALGKIRPIDGENVELIYSRLSHPNAEIVEDQIVPLETGATVAAVFNSGMAAISTLFLTMCRPGSSIVFTVPVYMAVLTICSIRCSSLTVSIPCLCQPATRRLSQRRSPRRQTFAWSSSRRPRTQHCR